MRAIVSSTYDDKYLFFLPIATWCWNKLGVDVICFLPLLDTLEENNKIDLISKTKRTEADLNLEFRGFSAPEHKKATYAQCSRIFAGGLPIPDDEILITSDVDMAVFKIPPFETEFFNIFGSDLVPDKQVPMCYVSATKKLWNQFLNKGRNYQDCLDFLLGEIECESFKSNYWAKDQEELYNSIMYYGPINTYRRARPGTQFASNRLDRDDSFLLDRLSPDIFDYHMPRPGYEEKAFEQILTVLKYFYPNDSFDWLVSYRNEYIKLL